MSHNMFSMLPFLCLSMADIVCILKECVLGVSMKCDLD